MRRIDQLIAEQYSLEVGKAVNNTYDFSSAGAVEIRFPDAVAIWGSVETPLLARCARNAKKATSIDHRFAALQIRAAAENAQKEILRNSDMTGRSAKPVPMTNTCQTLASLIEVTDDELQEARNGVFGPSFVDPIDLQTSVEVPALVGDLEWSMLYSAEVTRAAATTESARKMAGLFGTIGLWNNGLLTTADRCTVTNLLVAELEQSLVDAHLVSIVNAGAGAAHRPTAMYCSLEVIRKFAAFDNMIQLTVNVNDLNALANLAVGSHVAKYITPWASVMDVVYEPQCLHSASTPLNNHIGVLCEDDIAPCSFYGSPEPNEGEEVATGGFLIEPQPKDFSVNGVAIKASQTVEARVLKAHGLMTNFTVTL